MKKSEQSMWKIYTEARDRGVTSIVGCQFSTPDLSRFLIRENPTGDGSVFLNMYQMRICPIEEYELAMELVKDYEKKLKKKLKKLSRKK